MFDRTEAEDNSRVRVSIDDACGSNMWAMRSRVPQSGGDLRPAAGDRSLPIVLKLWPDETVEHQLAMPIFALPERQTRIISPTARS